MLHTLRFLIPALAVSLAAAAPGGAQDGLAVRVHPDRPILVDAGDTQGLSVDLEVANATDRDLRLALLEVRAFDPSGTLVFWRRMEPNGPRPGLETLGSLELAAGSSWTLFNPVYSFPAGLDIERVRFDLSYRDREGGGESVSADVLPRRHRQATELTLPIRGRTLWIYDGFDPLSHHRRIDLADPFNRDVMGITANSQRYAVDLVVVDDERRAFTGSPGALDAWVGTGVPILAPAGGRVVAVEGSVPDDVPFDQAVLRDNPLIMLGNFVVIDHRNGEYSLLAHFRQGTVRVEAGSTVDRGDVLGAMGRSGMGVGLVHLHYELRTAADLMTARGLPSAFVDVVRADGTGVADGLLQTGTFVRSR